MTTPEIKQEIRDLIRGFQRLTPEDQHLVQKWFAPRTEKVEEICRKIAERAPEVVRLEIKQTKRR